MRGFFVLLAAVSILVLPSGARAGSGNPYCPNCGGGAGAASSPEARYNQYKSEIGKEQGTAGKTAPKKFFLSGESSGEAAEPFYLKGIMENPTSTKYGMKYKTSLSPEPFSMGGGQKGASQKYPTVEDLQAMAQKDQQANLKSALAESAERTRMVKEMQDSWAKQQDLPAAQQGKPVAPGQGANAGTPETGNPAVRYVYRKSDPTRTQKPSRVFLDGR